MNDCDSQPTILSVIAETQPKVAYLARAVAKGGGGGGVGGGGGGGGGGWQQPYIN